MADNGPNSEQLRTYTFGDSHHTGIACADTRRFDLPVQPFSSFPLTLDVILDEIAVMGQPSSFNHEQ